MGLSINKNTSISRFVRPSSLAATRSAEFVRSNTHLVRNISKELINPLYDVASRRSRSSIAVGYRDLLDNWCDPNYSHSTYPKNSRGSLARLSITNAEYFINIPNLYKRILATTNNKSLRNDLQQCRMRGITYVRDIMLESLKGVGENDYRIEWNHSSTRDLYEVDLNKLTSTYFIGNEEIRKAVMQRFSKWASEGAADEFIVMDLGVGIGGTTVPIIQNMIEKGSKDPSIKPLLNKVKFILFDTDLKKVDMIQKAINVQLKFPKENLIGATGEFYNIGENFILSAYKGRITYMISGAAICHSCDKAELFNQLYGLLKSGGELMNWDPCVPFFYSPYLRIGKKETEERIIEASSSQGVRIFELPLGERMPEELLLLQESGVNIRSMAEIPEKMAQRFMTSIVDMNVPLLGYKNEVIGEEAAGKMRQEAWDYMDTRLRSREGFSIMQFIEWLNLRGLSYKIDDIARSPFQIIEALESPAHYEQYCVQAGFKSPIFNYFAPAENKRNTKQGEGLTSVIGLLITQK